MKAAFASVAALALMTAPALACGMNKTAGHHSSMSVASLDDTSAPMSAAEEVSVDTEITTGAIESEETETED